MTDKVRQVTKWSDVVAGFEKAVELCDLMAEVGHNAYCLATLTEWVGMFGWEVDRRLLKVGPKSVLDKGSFDLVTTGISMLSRTDTRAALMALTLLCELGLMTVKDHRPGTKKGLSEEQSAALGRKLWEMMAAIPVERPGSALG